MLSMFPPSSCLALRLNMLGAELFRKTWGRKFIAQTRAQLSMHRYNVGRRGQALAAITSNYEITEPIQFSPAPPCRCPPPQPSPPICLPEDAPLKVAPESGWHVLVFFNAKYKGVVGPTVWPIWPPLKWSVLGWPGPRTRRRAVMCWFFVFVSRGWLLLGSSELREIPSPRVRPLPLNSASSHCYCCFVQKGVFFCEPYRLLPTSHTPV